MKYEQSDIIKLLNSADLDERKNLAEILDLDKSSEPTGELLVKQLWWKYQSPIGYLARTPTFDEIGMDVTNKFMKKDPVADKSVWDVLAELTRYLFQVMLDNLDENQKEDMINALIDNDEINTILNTHDLQKQITLGTISAAAIINLPVMSAIVTTQSINALLRTSMLSILPRTLTFPVLLSPAGWLLVAWGINDLAGTNWKRIVPAILYISLIYQRLLEKGKLPYQSQSN